MDNSIHSTWKSERATFPRPANRVTHNSIRQPVIHIPTMPTTTESFPFLISSIKNNNTISLLYYQFSVDKIQSFRLIFPYVPLTD